MLSPHQTHGLIHKVCGPCARFVCLAEGSISSRIRFTHGLPKPIKLASQFLEQFGCQHFIENDSVWGPPRADIVREDLTTFKFPDYKQKSGN